MHLDAGAVQADHLDLDDKDLLFLQAGEHPLDDALFAPAVQPRVDRVPGAEEAGQAPPLAALFQGVKQGVEQHQVAHAHIAALARRTVLDAFVLFTAEFHRRSLPENAARSSSVNTP